MTEQNPSLTQQFEAAKQEFAVAAYCNAAVTFAKFGGPIGGLMISAAELHEGNLGTGALFALGGIAFGAFSKREQSRVTLPNLEQHAAKLQVLRAEING